MKTKVRYVTEHHTCGSRLEPYGKESPVIGMTIRKLLRFLRLLEREYFGDLGGALFALSDGTYIEVENTKCSDSSYLMGSQRITRVDGDDRIIRRYAW